MPAASIAASGPTYSVTRLCQSLIEGGLDVELAALQWGGGQRVPPFCREFPLGLGPRRLGRSPTMLRWLRAEVAAGATDLVHSHAMWIMPCVYPGRVVRRSDIPLVVSPRGSLAPEALQLSPLLKKAFWHLQQGPALRNAGLLHATSEAESDDIRSAGLYQPVAVIPNGVDIPPPRPPGERAGRRVLLYLGRVHPIKGLDVLLRAWGAVAARHADWELRVVGPGEAAHVAAVQRQARELKLERVKFLGPAYGTQRLAAYQAADIYVLPTRTENFGMTVAEALAAGTPVIVTKGAPWAGISDNHAGWWIDFGVEPLVESLDDAMARPASELGSMGERGRAWMIRDFSWSMIAAKMADTYHWLRDSTRPVPTWVRLN